MFVTYYITLFRAGADRHKRYFNVSSLSSRRDNYKHFHEQYFNNELILKSKKPKPFNTGINKYLNKHFFLKELKVELKVFNNIFLKVLDKHAQKKQKDITSHESN